MISLTALLYLVVIGAGLLALWTVMRFPVRRPTSISGALVLMALALLAAQLAPPLIPRLMLLPAGYYLALLGCVLPVFYAMFLTSGWLVLAILGRHGGPRGGHRVPLASKS